jgi:hypothetical protein
LQFILRAADPAQGADLCDQLTGMGHFGQIRVGAAFQPLGAIVVAHEVGGVLQDRDVGGDRVGLESPADLVAVDIGQVHVQQDDIGLFGRAAQGLSTGRDRPHGEAFEL